MKPNPMRDMVRTFRASVPTFPDGKRFAAKLRTPVKVGKNNVKAAEAGVGELYLYDAIGADWFGGISSKDVVRALQDLADGGAKTLNIFINSPGGDVFEGTAMYTAIARFDGEKNVYIDSLAASAASYVAMVGDKIYTAFNAMWMIHNPWGLVIGNAADMRKTADDLDKIGQTLVDTYVRRTGQTAEAVRAWLDAETWFNASEAKQFGFTDEIVDEEGEIEPGAAEPPPPPEESASARTSMLAKFKNTPAALRPSGRDMVRSMEQRIMSLSKRASPQTR